MATKTSYNLVISFRFCIYRSKYGNRINAIMYYWLNGSADISSMNLCIIKIEKVIGNFIDGSYSMREKRPYSGFFWSVFSCIRTEYQYLSVKLVNASKIPKKYTFHAVILFKIRDWSIWVFWVSTSLNYYTPDFWIAFSWFVVPLNCLV